MTFKSHHLNKVMTLFTKWLENRLLEARDFVNIQTRDGRSKTVYYLERPTPQQIIGMLTMSRGDIEGVNEKEVRLGETRDGDLFAWDGHEAVHADMEDALLRYEIIDDSFVAQYNVYKHPKGQPRVFSTNTSMSSFRTGRKDHRDIKRVMDALEAEHADVGQATNPSTGTFS